MTYTTELPPGYMTEPLGGASLSRYEKTFDDLFCPGETVHDTHYEHDAIRQ